MRERERGAVPGTGGGKPVDGPLAGAAVPGTGGGKPVDGPLAGAATGYPATIQQLIYMLLVNYFYYKKIFD